MESEQDSPIKDLVGQRALNDCSIMAPQTRSKTHPVASAVCRKLPIYMQKQPSPENSSKFNRKEKAANGKHKDRPYYDIYDDDDSDEDNATCAMPTLKKFKKKPEKFKGKRKKRETKPSAPGNNA